MKILYNCSKLHLQFFQKKSSANICHVKLLITLNENSISYNRPLLLPIVNRNREYSELLSKCWNLVQILNENVYLEIL